MRAARATARTGERAANGAGGTAVQRRVALEIAIPKIQAE